MAWFPFRLLGCGVQDVYLTSSQPPALSLLASLTWGELRDFPRAESVARLRADWQTLVDADAEQRYLVWAARHSPASPLYALPETAACSIVEYLRSAQAKRTRKAKQRYETARALLEVCIAGGGD